MEEPPQEAAAEVAEPWLSKWERQCLAEAEQREQLAPELQEAGAAAASGLQSERQKLWHLFQLSASAVAQLYQDVGGAQPALSMWDPFQHAAMAVTSLYKESGEAHQRSFDLGVQLGGQRRSKDLLEWARKGRSTIYREELISFLCGKGPPTPCTPRLPQKPPAGGAQQAQETSSSGDVDLRPFHEAIAQQGLSGIRGSIGGVYPGAPGSPVQANGVTDLLKSDLPREDGLGAGDAAGEVALGLDCAGSRKRTSAQFGEDIFDAPMFKRNRLL